MKRIKKILVCLVLLSSILYGGLVWTSPIPHKEHAIEDNTAIDYGGRQYYALHAEGNLSFFQKGKSANYNKNISMEPTVLFLFGSGILGFFIVARKKL